MKIINKYITGSFVAVFLGSLFAITFVLSLGGVFKIANLVAKGISFGPLVAIFFSGMPSAAALAIPLASLISVLLLFGRLSSDGEVAAMKSCGISLFSVSVPPILVSILLSVICLYIHNDLAPRAHMNSRTAIAALSSTSPIDMIEEGRNIKDFVDGITLYVSKKKDGVLQDVRIFDSTDPSFTREIRAKSGSMILDTNQMVILNLVDVSITPFAKDKPDPAYADEWPLQLGNLAKGRSYKPKEDDFTFGELIERIQNTEAFYGDLTWDKIPIKNMVLRVELHKRLSLSFSCMAFVVLGIPLGIKAHRKESSVGIGLSLVLVLNMFLFVVMAESLAKYPGIEAELIAWIPVALSLGIGTIMLRRSN